MLTHAHCLRGFWLETVNIVALELAASVGYSAAVIDMEHGGGMSPAGMDSMVLVGRRLGMDMLVRVADGSRAVIQQALDAGATGVVIPQIQTLADAEQASLYCKYPPLGTRGMGYGRTMYDGAPHDFPQRENARTKCWMMIETAEALLRVEEIAALPLVDGLFVGPADLSLARGRGLFRNTEEDLRDHRCIATAAQAAGKVWGMPTPNVDMARFAREEGAALAVIADDVTALRRGFEEALAETRL